MQEDFNSFEEFWPYYVREHSKALTRWFHFAGTSAAILAAAVLVRTRKLRYFPVLLVAGYGPAWFSHFFIEKNRPATFKYPVWSLRADFKMYGMILRGEMDAEVARVLEQYAAKENGRSSGGRAEAEAFTANRPN